MGKSLRGEEGLTRGVENDDEMSKVLADGLL